MTTPERGVHVSKPKLIPQLPTVLLLSFSAIYIGFLVSLIINTQAVEIRGIEPTVIYFIQRLLTGHSIYTSPELPPFSVNQYTPVYYYIVAGLAKSLSIGATDIEAINRLARLTSLGFSVALAVVVFQLVRREFRASTCIALFSAITCISLMFPYTVIARSDSTYIFLATIGFWFSLRFIRYERWSDFGLFVVFTLLAFMTKQTAVVFAALSGVNILVFARRKIAIRAFITGTALAVVFIVLLDVTYGKVFFDNVVRGVSNGIDIAHMVQHAWVPFLRSRELSLVAFCVAVLFFWSKIEHPYRPICVAAGLSLLIGAVLSSKYGSAPNYFNEFFLMVAMILGAIAKAISEPPAPNGSLTRKTNLLAVITSVTIAIGVLAENFPFLERMQSGKHAPYLYRVSAVVEEHRDDNAPAVFSDSPSLTLFLKEPRILPQWWVLASAAEAGALNLAPVVKEFDNGRVGLAVVRTKFCPPDERPRKGRGTSLVDRVERLEARLLKEFVEIERLGRFCILRFGGGSD